PILRLLFPEGRQLPQMVGIAEGVTARIVLVGSPSVMQSGSRKVRENTCRVHTDFAPFFMPSIIGQGLCPRRVQPMEFAAQSPTRFVEMHDRGGLETIPNFGKDIGKSRSTGLLGGTKRSRRERRVKEVGEECGNALVGEELVRKQIDAQ